VWVCGCVGVGVGGCVYKIEKFRTLSAPSEIASLCEAISSSAAFELRTYWSCYMAVYSNSGSAQNYKISFVVSEF
jgi:hypothetical protein